MPGHYNSFNADSTEVVARCDYAINAGDRGFNTIASGDIGGPKTVDEGDKLFAWPSTNEFTGVSFLRSSVAHATNHGRNIPYLSRR